MSSGRFNDALRAGVRSQDVRDAVEHLSEDCDTVDEDVDSLRFQGVELVWPEDVFPSVLKHKRKPKGWLLKLPRSGWAKALHIYCWCERDFSHIIEQHDKDEMPPGIVIDGYFADGFGRAIFHYGVGEKMKVAKFTSPRGQIGHRAEDR